MGLFDNHSKLFQQEIERLAILAAEEYLKRTEVERETAEAIGKELIQRAYLERQSAENEKALREKWAEQSKEFMRPFRVAGATITYDEATKEWTTSFCDVIATGDTPEMSCDNFDHLWIYGKEEQDAETI